MKHKSYLLFFITLAFLSEVNPAFAIKDPEATAPFTGLNPPRIRVADAISDLPATHNPCIEHLEFPNESNFSLLSIQYQNVFERQLSLGSKNNPVELMILLLRTYVGDVQDAIRDSHLDNEQKKYWRTILAAHSLGPDATSHEVRAYIKDLADLNEILVAQSNFKIKMFLGPVFELAVANEIMNREDVRTSELAPAAFESARKTIDELKIKSVRDKIARAIPQNYGKNAELMEQTVINLGKLAGKLPDRISHLIKVLDCRLKTWQDLRSPQVQPTNTNQLLVQDLFHEMLIYIHEIENAVNLAGLANVGKPK